MATGLGHLGHAPVSAQQHQYPPVAPSLRHAREARSAPWIHRPFVGRHFQPEFVDVSAMVHRKPDGIVVLA